jgi:hypothetical protein
MRTQQCMAPKPIERHLSLLRTGHGLERDKRAPASGLSACRLELEITEAVLIRDGEAALANCTTQSYWRADCSRTSRPNSNPLRLCVTI